MSAPRSIQLGAVGPAVLDQVVRHADRRGDHLQVLVMRTDEAGAPTGNREERRRAARILRHRKA